MYNLNDYFEEIIFSMLLFVAKTDVSMLKEYKIVQLLNILESRNNDNFIENTYDEYYEDVDEYIKESNKNFFVDLYSEYDERFTCNGVLDDDDLKDFDDLLSY